MRHTLSLFLLATIGMLWVGCGKNPTAPQETTQQTDVPRTPSEDRIPKSKTKDEPKAVVRDTLPKSVAKDKSLALPKGNEVFASFTAKGKDYRYDSSHSKSCILGEDSGRPYVNIIFDRSDAKSASHFEMRMNRIRLPSGEHLLDDLSRGWVDVELSDQHEDAFGTSYFASFGGVPASSCHALYQVESGWLRTAFSCRSLQSQRRNRDLSLDTQGTFACRIYDIRR